MKWLAVAFGGWAIGMTMFAIAWAVLVNSRLVKFEDDKAMPRQPTIWAMSIAFVVLSLIASGLVSVFPSWVDGDPLFPF